MTLGLFAALPAAPKPSQSPAERRGRRRFLADRRRHRRDSRRPVGRGGGERAVPAGRAAGRCAGQMGDGGCPSRLLADGLVEVDAVDATNDVQANASPFSAAIDVAPAINPEASGDRGQPCRRRHPRNRLALDRAQHLRRPGAVIDLGGDMQPITRARPSNISSGGEGAGDAGGSAASRGTCCCAARSRRPATCACDRRARAGARAQSRAARGSGENPYLLPGSSVSDDVLLTRFDAAALGPVLQGRQLLLVHAERASESSRCWR